MGATSATAAVSHLSRGVPGGREYLFRTAGTTNMVAVTMIVIPSSRSAMRRLQHDVCRAPPGGLIERIGPGVLGVAPDSLDDSELFTARLRARHHYVCRQICGLVAGLHAAKRQHATRAGEPVQI